MMTGVVHDQNLEKQIQKQMGCMAGFLQLFDRQQILTTKRLQASKRLTPTVVESTSESEKSVGSPEFSREQRQQRKPEVRSSPECTKPSPSLGIPSQKREIAAPAEIPAKESHPLPLPVFEFNEGLRSTWKFRESPRLSLDSRATVGGKGSLYPREIRTNAAILSATGCDLSAEASDNEKQHRSPSVIARLMGLEALPNPSNEPTKNAELRRSASESRVSRDLLQCRLNDGNNFLRRSPFPSNAGSNILSNVIWDEKPLEDDGSNVATPDWMEMSVRKPKFESPKAVNGRMDFPPWKPQQHRKSFFVSQDFFPEPKQTSSLYGEIEKRLKMRGIDEPAKDLDTLKQILEALQLKGLLHSRKAAEKIGHRNIVYDWKSFPEESPIVVMKPSRSSRSPVSINRAGRIENGCSPSTSSLGSKSGVRRNLNLAGEMLSPVRQSQDRPQIDQNFQNERRARNSRSPDRNENSSRSPSSLAKRKPLNVDVQRRVQDSLEQRRNSPINSPKLSSKKTGSDQMTSRSPRNRKPTTDACPKQRISVPAEDESSSISESSISTSSQVDSELQRSKTEDYKEGRSLLERCDKLLHSIAEFTLNDLQASPVSVLDSSLYKDELSPSPVKRSLDFNDRLVESEVNWSPVVPAIGSKSGNISDDSDFSYISEVLRARDRLLDDSDVFLLVEKQHFRANNCSKASSLHRKLLFDTIKEILGRKRQLPPWKTVCVTEKPALQEIWTEFVRIRDRDPAEDLLEDVSGALKKDMAGDAINGWGDSPIEVSETVLDIERMIFKDLVVETMRDLAFFFTVPSTSRRKLVF